MTHNPSPTWPAGAVIKNSPGAAERFGKWGGLETIDREFEFYEFFSFLKFNEFYEFFSVEKIRKKFVILQIIDV